MLRDRQRLRDELRKLAPVEEMPLAEMSFATQVCAASRARCIVGAHGAGLTHVAFMQRGGIVEICPPGFVIDCFAKLAARCERSHIAIEGIGKAKGDVNIPQDRSHLRSVKEITYDLEAVVRAVKQLL